MIWNDKLGCYCVNDLCQIDLMLLKQNHVELLIFDIRGTIIVGKQINQFFLDLIKQIKQLGCFQVLFATNNCAYYTHKIANLLATINFNASYLYFACKPFLFRMQNAVKKIQLNNLMINHSFKIAIIGNQLNTDGKLAKKMHATLIYLNKDWDK